MKRYLPIGLYVPATAGAAVYAKVGFEGVTPFLITFATFVLCWALFLLINARRLVRLARLVRTDVRPIMLINIYTLLSWVGIFACIQLLSGSVELIVFMSVIPLCSVLAGGEWPALGQANRLAVVMIAAAAAAIVLVHPQMRLYGTERQAFGWAVGVGAGAFGALYIVLSGRVQRNHGLTTIDLICLRLPLLVAVTFLASIHELIALFSWTFVLKVAFLSAVAVIIPAYTLQRSISELGSVPTSILMPLVPAVALGFEWAGGVLLSGLGMGAIVLQCLAIMWLSFSLAKARAAKARANAMAQDAAATGLGHHLKVT